MKSFLLSRKPKVVLCATFGLLLAASQTAFTAGVVTHCSEADLRAAMAGGGTVTFACDGTITLTNTLTITADNTILDASGHSVTLSGGGTLRIILVQSGVRLELRGLTIANGFSSGPSTGGLGGGLANFGEATIADCTFSNNIVVDGPVFGGAINHAGTRLVVTGTTFIQNNSEVWGSAISCGNPALGVANGNVAITNCTFYANGPQAISVGEPLLNPVTIVNCTFAWNTNAAVRHVTSGAYPTAAKVYLMNSIVANTVGGDGAQGIVDWGHNISTDNSASLTNTSSLRNTDPMLGALADNGGPTWTMALASGSPALNQANPVAFPTTDQRGVARPVGPAPDIGAYEGTAAALPGVRFSSASYWAGEGALRAAIQVERTGSSAGTATVVFSASPGTATAQDFAPTNLVVSFGEGVLARTVYVSITDDSQIEPDETVVLELSNPSGAVLEPPSTATLHIIDDDQPTHVSSCDESGLRTALSNGTWIVFNCDGVISLSSPITVSGYKILDAGNRSVTLDGNNAVRLFNVTPGAHLTLKNLTLARGNRAGGTGAANIEGELGFGGAAFVDGGELTALDCRFWTNSAIGGTGGNPSGTGGKAFGGAVSLTGGAVFNASNCEFLDNTAQGGFGASPVTLAAPGAGGPSWGGAIHNHNSRVVLADCQFTRNLAHGGRAGSGSSGAIGGNSAGGAIFNDGGDVLLVNCSLNTNQSVSGQGNRSGAAGTSGMASGGGIETTGGEVTLQSCLVRENLSQAEVLTAARGGAITQTGGLLVVSDSTFQSNRVEGGFGLAVSTPLGLPGGPAYGGCLYVLSGTASFTNSTLASNVATGGAQVSGNRPGAGLGGAVYNVASLTLINCTVAGNAARAGNNSHTGMQGGAYGGGLYNAGTFLLMNVTLANNAAVPGGTNAFNPNPIAQGGGIFSTNGVATSINTILAYNFPGSNSFGALTDGGHNLSSDASCGFSSAGSLNNTDPVLGPLDDYGGLTPTIPLLAGSPAIDGGDPTNHPPTDQRGRTRPYGPAADIGAYESSPPFVIRGQVSGFTLADEVQLAAGATSTVTTNRGVYSLGPLALGDHTVAPSSADYVFVPDNRLVAVGPDQLGVNFQAYHWNALSLDGISNNLMQLMYAGTNGHTVRLLESSDLLDWVAVLTNTIGSSNLAEFLVPVSLETPKQFYRTAEN